MLQADYSRRAGIAQSYREAAGITDPHQVIRWEGHKGNPELEAMRQDTIRALQIRDEQADLAGMDRGQLEAKAIAGARARAAAPRDVSAELRGTAQQRPTCGYREPKRWHGGRTQRSTTWRRTRWRSTGQSWKRRTLTMRHGRTRLRKRGRSRRRRSASLSGAGTRCRSGRRRTRAPSAQADEPEGQVDAPEVEADAPEVEADEPVMPEPETNEPEAADSAEPGARAGVV